MLEVWRGQYNRPSHDLGSAVIAHQSYSTFLKLKTPLTLRCGTCWGVAKEKSETLPTPPSDNSNAYLF